MDSDDISLPRRFEKQIHYLEHHPDVDILGSWAEDIDAMGRKFDLRKVPSAHDDIVKYIWTCPLIHPTVIFKREAIISVGSYSAHIKRRQDYELWFRCVKQGLEFANLQEPLLLYRLTDDTFLKNNPRAIWQQVKIGWKGCYLIGASPKAYIGTVFPLVKIILPRKIIKKLSRTFKRIDPRNRNL
jgi:hypothetical protein